MSALPQWLIKRETSQAGYVSEHEYPYLDSLIGCWFHQGWDAMTLDTPTSNTTGDTTRIAPSRRRRVPLFMLLGAISGATSALAVSIFLIFAPGIIFGVVFGTLLVRRGWMSPLRAPAWGLASTVACVAAIYVMVEISGPENTLAVLVGGLAGGGLLSAATRLFVPGTRWLLPTAVGAALSPLLPILGPSSSATTFIFCAIWQSGYAAALAMALPPPQRVRQDNK